MLWLFFLVKLRQRWSISTKSFSLQFYPRLTLFFRSLNDFLFSRTEEGLFWVNNFCKALKSLELVQIIEQYLKYKNKIIIINQQVIKREWVWLNSKKDEKILPNKNDCIKQNIIEYEAKENDYIFIQGVDLCIFWNYFSCHWMFPSSLLLFTTQIIIVDVTGVNEIRW